MTLSPGAFLLFILPALITEVFTLFLAAICGALSMAKKEPLWPLGLVEIIIFAGVYIYVGASLPLFD
jgi:hypothetical protein